MAMLHGLDPDDLDPIEITEVGLAFLRRERWKARLIASELAELLAPMLGMRPTGLGSTPPAQWNNGRPPGKVAPEAMLAGWWKEKEADAY